VEFCARAAQKFTRSWESRSAIGRSDAAVTGGLAERVRRADAWSASLLVGVLMLMVQVVLGGGVMVACLGYCQPNALSRTAAAAGIR
jgi:hypothetical protein